MNLKGTLSNLVFQRGNRDVGSAEAAPAELEHVLILGCAERTVSGSLTSEIADYFKEHGVTRVRVTQVMIAAQALVRHAFEGEAVAGGATTQRVVPPRLVVAWPYMRLPGLGDPYVSIPHSEPTGSQYTEDHITYVQRLYEETRIKPDVLDLRGYEEISAAAQVLGDCALTRLHTVALVDCR